MKSLLSLQKSGKTVFTTLDMGYFWGLSNKESLKTKIHYWTRTGKLKSLRKGLYALDDGYDSFEVASCLRRPSYISLETVLSGNSVIFQYSSGIQSVSYISNEIQVDGKEYLYRKIKDDVLTNKKGLILKSNYTIATLERAFLDMLYLNPEYHFDNLDPINWEKSLELVYIYKKKSLELKLKKLYKNYVKQRKT